VSAAEEKEGVHEGEVKEVVHEGGLNKEVDFSI
jgi:hypothetical protein